MILATPLLPIIFLVGATLMVSLKAAFSKLDPKYLTRDLQNGKLPYLPFRLLGKLFPEERLHPALDFLFLTELLNLIGFAVSCSFFVFANYVEAGKQLNLSYSSILSFPWFVLFLGIIFSIALVALSTFYLFSVKAHLAALKLFSFLGFLYLLAMFPLSLPLLWLKKSLAHDLKPTPPALPTDKLKSRLEEILQDDDFISRIDPRDKKIVKSLAQFGDLVCREIMVPRVHIECLEENASLYDALRLFTEEGYSRLPIYRESIDHMTGVLLYKDVIKYLFENLGKDQEALSAITIRDMVTPLIYAPENKKIRNLFHEMRTQRSHAAIVVNEYGCTEGLVTIEDILEEIVGSEIQDEHDSDEEMLYQQTGDQGWIVEAKMLIVDAERELGIAFPHHPEYETVGGYIFHVTGIIPVAGSVIHLDQYNIRVLSSDKRQIHKVKITQESTPTSTGEIKCQEEEPNNL